MNYLQKKKLAFMSIVNQIKGFIRTISGAFPLTLTDCVDNKSITNYSIHGNSMQDGVPTPDAPIEVESVGELTRNLITANDGYIHKISENSYIKYETETQVFTIQGHGLLTHVYFPETIPSGTTTSIFAEIINDDYEIVKGELTIGGYGVSPSWQNVLNFSATSAKKQSGVYTITADINRICIFVDANADVKNVKVRITYAVCDTALTEYEPYGYKIPITVSGKNIANFSIVSNQYNVKTEKIAPNIFKVTKSNNDAVAYGQIETYLEIGKTYTLFRMSESEKPIGNIPAWKEYNAGGVYNYMTPTYFTFTATQEKFILGLYPNQSADLKGLEATFTFMLVEGSYTSTTFPDYEPYHESISTNIYLDEPLRKVGDYADYIDFENGKVIRQVLEESFDGSESWYLWETALNNHVKYALGNVTPILNGGGDIKVLSNMFMHSTTYEKDTMNAYRFPDIRGWIAATVDVETFPNVEDFKNFLSTQSNVNKPLKVYFAMPKKETPLTLPIIPTFKGTSIISVDTTIQPSNAEIEYYSNAKER